MGDQSTKLCWEFRWEGEEKIVAACQRGLSHIATTNSCSRTDGFLENQDANIFIQFHAIIYIIILRKTTYGFIYMGIMYADGIQKYNISKYIG